LANFNGRFPTLIISYLRYAFRECIIIMGRSGPNYYGPFCALGRFVPWVVLRHGSFCAVGRFVPWVVLSLGRFELGSF
jgi:hypothetical protein